MSSVDRESATSTSDPWPAKATRRVRDLRGAITSNAGAEMVDTDVAPLLPDLLTRMEAVGRPEPEVDLEAPDPPDTIEPPSGADEMYVLRRAARKLEAGLERTAGPSAIRELVDTLEHYRRLREDVVIRSET